MSGLTQPAAALLLVVQLTAVRWFVKGDVAGRLRSRRIDRLPRYRRWIVKSWIGFAAPAIFGLLMLGRGDALLAMPPEFASLAATLPAFGASDLPPLIEGAVGGLALGTILVVVVTRWRRPVRPFGQIGDLSSILPRTRRELLPAAWLSLSAGVTEELTFRLFVPLIVAILTDSALAGFVAAGLLFGAMHRYQGWAGVAVTTAAGVLFAWLYLSTGRLWPAMLFHAAIDLNGIVVRPMLTGVWRR